MASRRRLSRKTSSKRSSKRSTKRSSKRSTKRSSKRAIKRSSRKCSCCGYVNCRCRNNCRNCKCVKRRSPRRSARRSTKRRSPRRRSPRRRMSGGGSCGNHNGGGSCGDHYGGVKEAMDVDNRRTPRRASASKALAAISKVKQKRIERSEKLKMTKLFKKDLDVEIDRLAEMMGTEHALDDAITQRNKAQREMENLENELESLMVKEQKMVGAFNAPTFVFNP